MQNAFFNLIVAGLLSFATQPAMAQGTITPAQADSLSWKYYLSGDWDSLIEIGEQAQQQGIGFKYLHQRMGYAWYLKGVPHASYWKEQIAHITTLEDVHRITAGIKRELK